MNTENSDNKIEFSLKAIFPDNLNIKDKTVSTANSSNDTLKEVEVKEDNYIIEILSNDYDFLFTDNTDSTTIKEIPHKLKQFIEYILYMLSREDKIFNLLFILGIDKSIKPRDKGFQQIINECLNQNIETFDYLLQRLNGRKIAFMEAYLDKDLLDKDLLKKNDSKSNTQIFSKLDNLEAQMVSKEEMKKEMNEMKKEMNENMNSIMKKLDEIILGKLS